ncbi:MAG TPA: YceI family protein [candidate division Zixibacteria bacterium]|nr:YceI family protein [candidate division Zixibacteria bacterium]
MFNRVAQVLTVVALSSSTLMAGTWQVDPNHSSIDFSVRHMVISNVKGGFRAFQGEAEFDQKDLTPGSANFTIDAASISTDNDRRDGHLKSADFFDVEKYPKISFKSTGVSDVQGDHFKLNGDLTIKDVTKPVTFDCVFNGAVKDGQGNLRAGFSATTRIDRMDYHIMWDKTLDTGGLVAGNEVNIDLELEMVQKPAGE